MFHLATLLKGRSDKSLSFSRGLRWQNEDTLFSIAFFTNKSLFYLLYFVTFPPEEAEEAFFGC
jgi:hypothetical protein